LTRRSHGLRSRTRKKLKKHPRERGLSPISKAIQEFNEGQNVSVVIDPGLHKGQPHPRFYGRIGKIIGKRGRAYVIAIADGNKMKEIVARPEHLKPI